MISAGSPLRYKYYDRRQVGLAHFSETMGELAHFAQILDTALMNGVYVGCMICSMVHWKQW